MRAPGIESTTASGEVNFRFAVQRNHALTPGGGYLLLGSLGALVLAISVGFALCGAWLVLPFAGLELLGLGLAFWVMERHIGDYESVSICGDVVLIEREEGGRVRTFEFNRHWVQVVFKGSENTQGGKLALRSHGREVEFGIHLTAKQRAATARRLRERLSIR